jgi:hypothetical protein
MNELISCEVLAEGYWCSGSRSHLTFALSHLITMNFNVATPNSNSWVYHDTNF